MKRRDTMERSRAGRISKIEPRIRCLGVCTLLTGMRDM